MKEKRRRHDPGFKVSVALEAIKRGKTIQEIAKDIDVHPVQLSDWKKTMAANAASVFGPGAGKSTEEHLSTNAKGSTRRSHSRLSNWTG